MQNNALTDICWITSIADGYYHEWVLPQDQSFLAPLAGRTICRRCHPRCKICTAYGFHEQVCQQCTGYKRGEQCEDECPSDHYADEELRECIPCDTECRGCTGPGPANCYQCRNFKIYSGEPSVNNTMFNCTATCTKDFPYKIIQQDLSEPYCSSVAVRAGLSSPDVDATIYLAFSFGFVVFVIVLAVGSLWHCRMKEKTKKEMVNMTRVMAGSEDAEPLRPSTVGANLTKFRVIKEKELRKSSPLGMGAFGKVYKGVWLPEGENAKIPVAIKILIDMNSGYLASKEFLEEAYIMATVDHPNLLKLSGVCMTSQMMLITQLMPLGSLLEYIKKNKDRTGSKALLNWSTQIAKGMAYLEERRLVHRDLAARNVLVQNPSFVKITDFGLAKLLSNESNEYKADGGKMPIKWLALECIRHRIFNSQSDVWAFGVTIWELLTFGARPFENIPAKAVMDYIEQGGKLEQPEGCSLDVHCTLLSCWNIEAKSRPTFKQLVDIFQGYAQDPGRYLCIAGDQDMRLPSYTSQDKKDLIRSLAMASQSRDPVIPEAEEYLSTKRPPIEAGPSHVLPSVHRQLSAGDNLALKRYMADPRRVPGDDETDANGREVAVGNIRLDLPLDEDDYLMPTSQSQSGGAAGGYMDLIGTPACIDNPEYLMGSTASPNDSPPPTQTIGIPITLPAPMIEGEQTSDHEYYNDLQRELQPLQRNETTV